MTFAQAVQQNRKTRSRQTALRHHVQPPPGFERIGPDMYHQSMRALNDLINVVERIQAHPFLLSFIRNVACSVPPPVPPNSPNRSYDTRASKIKKSKKQQLI